VVDRVDIITEITANTRQQTVLAVINTTMKLSIQCFEARMSIIKQQYPYSASIL